MYGAGERAQRDCLHVWGKHEEISLVIVPRRPPRPSRLTCVTASHTYQRPPSFTSPKTYIYISDPLCRCGQLNSLAGDSEK